MSETVTLPATAQSTTITDSLGRKLVIKKLSVIEEMNLFEAAGELSENRRWMTYATFSAMVRDTDGVPMGFPANKLQIMGQVKRVGAEGITAVIDFLAPPEPTETEDAQPGEAKAAA